MKTLVDIITDASAEIKNDRTIQDILNHAMTELGELALEVQIAEGKSYKQPGKDGVVGEALDVIACMVDIIYTHYGVLATEEYMISLMKPKLDKWQEKDMEIRNKKSVSMSHADCGNCKYHLRLSSEFPCNSCAMCVSGYNLKYEERDDRL